RTEVSPGFPALPVVEQSFTIHMSDQDPPKTPPVEPPPAGSPPVVPPPVVPPPVGTTPVGTTPVPPVPQAKPKPNVVDYKELWKPLPIDQIIMADYDFIVFLSTDDYLDWQTMPSIDDQLAKLAKPDVSAVQNRATEG